MPSLAAKLEVLGATCAFDISAPYYEPRKLSYANEELVCSIHQSRRDLLDQVGESCIYPAAVSQAQDRGGTSCGIIPLFKALLSNACANACKYCFTLCEKRKVTFTPAEYASTFAKFYQAGKVKGVFISSGILRGDPDYTTELMLDAVRLIREEFQFSGYVHFKCLPGVSRDLLGQAAEFATRISVNLEAPNAERLALIAEDKDFTHDLVQRQKWISELQHGSFIPSGQTTQFVVGAADETDAELLTRVDWAYHEVRLRRAYYSAFAPLKGTPLENHPATPPARERRLYMADFLLRQYKVPITDMRGIYTDQGFLPPGDPKVHLARAFFAPGEKVEVNEADFDLLIRVPGIGLKTARRILELRDGHQLIKKPKQLQLLGAVLPKALPFLTISGTGQSTLDQFLVRNLVIRK